MSNLKAAIKQTLQTAATGSLLNGVASNLKVNAGEGNDTVILNGDYNEVLGETGDDTIMLVGDFNQVFDNGGDNIISSEGNFNYIDVMNGNNTIKSVGDFNTILANNGNQDIESHGNYNLINGGNGNNTVFFTGNHNDVSVGNGNSNIYFWGDRNSVGAGNGNHTIKTLDWLVSNGQYTEWASLLDESARYSETSEVVKTETVDESHTAVATGNEGVGTARYSADPKTSTKTSTPSTAQLVSMLSAAEQAAVARLNMSEMYNGSPRYVFAYGSGDKKVHVYDMKTTKSIVSLPQGNNYIYTRGVAPKINEDGVASYVVYSETTTSTKVSSGNYADLINSGSTIYATQTTKGTIDYVKNTKTYDYSHMVNNITVGDGASTINYTGSGQIKYGDKLVNGDNPNVVQRGAIQIEKTTIDKSKLVKDVVYYTGTTSVSGKTWGTSSTQVNTGSPLIVDFNQDGKVSAEAGKGVDVDNNGRADGAATGGDKMLAMSDSNGNGKIDGSEVFGDQTVDPFTGKKINAKNGFEALKQVAKSAYEKTGINCMEGSNVNLQALKVALSLIGVNLGFISDDNVTQLEDLAHVKSINVEDYTTQNESGDVQHNQQGSYTSVDGKTYKTDDVWFKLQ